MSYLSTAAQALQEVRASHATVRDPRPDLTDDAALWARLLALSWARDGSDRCGVHDSLLGMRCIGVQLVVGVGTCDCKRAPRGPASRRIG